MDKEREAENAKAFLDAFGLVGYQLEASHYKEAVPHWHLALRMPQRQWFEIGLRVDGVWVVLPDAGATTDWKNLRGDEFPTLHQAVTHYLLTVTE